MRRAIAVGLVAVVLVAVVLGIPGAAAADPAGAALPLHPQNPVSLSLPWWSWAMLDTQTGQTWGSPSAGETTRSASMSKFWLAALFLRAHDQPTPAQQATLSTMIRDSDNNAANGVFAQLGGRGPVIEAMGSLCGITGPTIGAGYTWASTMISATDTARLGDCVAAGKVASPEWTQWILDQMRHVEGNGDFGIRAAFPADQRAQIAIKNGWDPEDDTWYVNCLAIGDGWVLAVETRSAALASGQAGCESVASQLLG